MIHITANTSGLPIEGGVGLLSTNSPAGHPFVAETKRDRLSADILQNVVEEVPFSQFRRPDYVLPPKCGTTLDAVLLVPLALVARSERVRPARPKQHPSFVSLNSALLLSFPILVLSRRDAELLIYTRC